LVFGDFPNLLWEERPGKHCAFMLRIRCFSRVFAMIKTCKAVELAPNWLEGWSCCDSQLALISIFEMIL